MSCPHGHAPRLEEEYGSGECYTCLETMGVPCGCAYCIQRLQNYLDAWYSTPDDEYLTVWHHAAIRAALGPAPTKESYAHAMFMHRQPCECANRNDAAHDDDECCAVECFACAVVRCPKNEPLHFHHDGCPAGCDAD